MSSGQPDAELIARSRSDPAAFAGVFDRHHAQLYRYLRRRVDSGLAADLAAETFVVAFARRDAYSADTQDARPWLYGIAHNLLRNHLRAERRQLAAYARHGVDPLADADAAVAFAMADSRADSAAVSAKLAQILAAMADRDRDVLLLFAWADMSYAEIGQALEIPVGTVRSRLHRARRQLRALVSATSLNAESLTAESLTAESLTAESLTAESRTAESRTAESRTAESLNYTETKAWTN